MQGTIEKRRASRRINFLKRVMIVQNKVSELYEPENQSKSKAKAYRKHISILFPMGERTFWRYMGMSVENIKEEIKTADNGQLMLQFD